MCAINPLAAGRARLHMHTYSCCCVGVCCHVYEKIIVRICWKNKVARAVGADLALAETCWFGLSNAFINDDEWPLQFTSNQRPLTAAQRWSPLAKWFSWPVVFRAAKELATWRSGCRWDCCAGGTQLDQSFLKQRCELGCQQAHRYLGSKALKGQLEWGSLKIKTFTARRDVEWKGVLLTLPFD